MAGTKRTRRREDTDGRRAALVAAAGRVIARDGIAAATTRRIAAEAGLPLGMVHYWFSGKDDLLEAVVEDAVADLSNATLATQVEARLGSAPNLRDSFAAAWKVIEDDDPGHQLALYELTTVALRTEGMAPLAAQQYTAYRDVAQNAARAWFESNGKDLPGGLEALGRLISVVFDGTALAFLADGAGTQPDQIFDLLTFLLENAATKAETN